VDPRKTNPGSPIPCPFGGAGTDLALHNSSMGGELGGWIAMPHTTFPPSALQSWALEPDANAGAARMSTGTTSNEMSLRTPASLHVVAKFGT